MQSSRRPTFVATVLALVLVCGNATGAPLGTAFTYQGALEEGGAPANGIFDLQLHLYAVAFGGTPLQTLLKEDVPVSDGVFTVELDFGEDEVNDGDELWLGIEVSEANAGVFTPLSPRQHLTAAPYALFARQAGGLATKGGAWMHTGVLGSTWFAQPGNSMAHRFGVEPFGGAPGSAKFVVDNQGRVGIGTFNPIAELDVKGKIVWGNSLAQLSTDQGASIELRGTGSPYIDFSNDTGTDFDMRIGLSGDNSLTIEGGNVGIGGTVTNPVYKLELPNVAGPGGQGRANAWIQYSSVRWKERISTIDDAIDKLRGLRGVEFDWKEDYGGGHGLGFVAEEVGAVLPELVEWEDEGPYAEGLSYSGVLPVLVEAMKEQLRMIERQGEEIERLKALIEATAQ